MVIGAGGKQVNGAIGNICNVQGGSGNINNIGIGNGANNNSTSGVNIINDISTAVNNISSAVNNNSNNLTGNFVVNQGINLSNVNNKATPQSVIHNQNIGFKASLGDMAFYSSTSNPRSSVIPSQSNGMEEDYLKQSI